MVVTIGAMRPTSIEWVEIKVVLNIPQCAGQPRIQKNDLVQNVSSAKVGKSCLESKIFLEEDGSLLLEPNMVPYV